MIDPRLRWIGYDGSLVINLGAGINPIQGAHNVDLIQKPGVDEVVDLTKYPWPWKDGSWDKILAFHVIEHIPVEQALPMFLECQRILKPGGVLILECPDIIGLARDLVAGNMGALRHIYSGDRAQGDQHRWGYDPSSLTQLAMSSGFFQCLTKPGTDYHGGQMATVRLEAVRGA